MAVKDLQARQGNVEIELEITEVGEPRTFEKFGKSGKVANATGKDETGQVKISLWNEQVDQIKAGDKVKISNGWVSEWQGELQLSTGKFGKLEVLGKSEGGDAPAAPTEPTPEQQTPPVDEEKVE